MAGTLGSDAEELCALACAHTHVGFIWWHFQTYMQ